MSDKIPWPEGSDPQLQRVLRSAVTDEPESDTIDSLASRLGPVLAAGAVIGGASAASAATAGAATAGAATAGAKSGLLSALGAKWITIAALSAATVGGGVIAYQATDNDAPPVETTEETAATAAPESPEAAPAPTPSVAPVVFEDDETVVEAEPTSEDPPRRTRRAPNLQEETELLDTARRQLVSDPVAALRIAETHRRQFPRGTLRQEREVVAIDALERAGRSAAARRRGERFLRRHPRSAHAATVRRLIAASR